MLAGHQVSELQQQIDELREQNTVISRERDTALAAVRASVATSGSPYYQPTSPGHHSQASPGHQHPHSPGHHHHHHHQQSPGHQFQVEATGPIERDRDRERGERDRGERERGDRERERGGGGAFSLPGPSKPTSSNTSHSSEEIGTLEKRLRDITGDIHLWEEKTRKVSQALDQAKKR